MRRLVALGALGGIAFGASGCIEDSDCGVCDPDNLILESISGINYASKKIHLLDPACEGEECPESFDKGQYFIEELGPCETAEETISEVGEDEARREEYCKLSPLVTAFGIEFIFNNLLDPTSIELVRKRPDNPNLFEVYDWKQRVLEIQGPITRYNGDYDVGATEEPDTVSRLVNLSCVEKLEGYGHEDYEDPATNPCNQIDPQTGLPRKLQPNGTITSYAGQWTAGTNSCSSPEDGPDTCCSQCDYLLSTRIARYGLTSPIPLPVAGDDVLSLEDARQNFRNPNAYLQSPDSPPANAAITCNPAAEDPALADKYIACRDFVPFVDRSDEEDTWEYFWGEGQAQKFLLPQYDLLRQTHPDDRPDGLVNTNAVCINSGQCRDEEVHDLPGTECVGELESGGACSLDVARGAEDEACGRRDDTGNFIAGQGYCEPEWFVTCRANADTTGGEIGFCQDRRFSDQGTAACFESTASFRPLCDDAGENCTNGTAGAGFKLAFCDGTENGLLSAGECCQPGLGTPPPETGDGEEPQLPACDPFYQENVRPIDLWERDRNLPEPTKNCICSREPAEGCEETVRRSCYDGQGNYIDERDGEYAIKFVGRAGGIIYDPAIKGIEYRPADIGGIPRADVENCAEGRSLIGQRNRHEGWRANDAFLPENFEDFDRAMCSDSTYTVVFQEPGENNQYIQDKVGNSLEGKSTYTFTTPKFHVVPGSGFPTDNLRIGACDDFSIRFSNKYDMSPENLNKLQLFRLSCDADGANCEPTTPNDECNQIAPVAGGPGCVESQDALDEGGPCARPCLTIDVANQNIGEVGVEINPTEFGAVLETRSRYRIVVPTAASTEQAFTDPDIYQAVFWDACGMPLVAEDALEYSYDFSIDQPKCREDADQDNVQLSCDNAPDFFNPDQDDLDGDGVGDVVDLCVTVPSAANNSADSDKDGVGNECDNCRQATKQYNTNADAISLPAELRVRNIPFQGDQDGDGIGDVCDNCVLTANCEEFGPDEPWAPGQAIAFDNPNLCQRDDNANMIGDACEGQDPLPGAAGPIGYAATDDFDQDGVPNQSDICPRQPVEAAACQEDADCPNNAGLDANTFVQTCYVPEGQTEGVCNHLDTDGDNVGDICDTCPFIGNEMQIVEGGMQEDDEDGDFVGQLCETDSSCANRNDPRPYSFYEIAANGYCCTVQLVEADDGSGDLINVETGNRLVAPARAGEPEIPIRRECSEEDEDAGICRFLPTAVARTPGILEVPPGCEEALAGTSPLDNRKLSREDFETDPVGYWDSLCFLPQFDQDFDGLGEPCDLCPFDFDPDDLPYIDDNGRVWPQAGRFCNGDYSIENRCEAEDPGMGGETDGDTDGMGTDGMETDGGSGGSSGGAG